MKHILSLLALLVLAVPVSAAITVTPSSVGTNYILWEWTPGTDLTDMFIDGNQMCGYETTNTSFLLPDLNPDELHTITLINGTDTGTNSTRTLAANVTPGSGGGSSGDLLAPGVALGTAIGIIIFAGRKKET